MNTYKDLIEKNLSYLSGNCSDTCYHEGPLDEETIPHKDILYEINKYGILTICSQPGFLSKGNLRQKPFVEMYCDSMWLPVFKKLEEKSYKSVAIDNLGNIVYKTPDIYLPDTVTMMSGNSYTKMPSEDILAVAFHEYMGDSTPLIQNKILVNVYYPKFWDKPIFKDLLKEITLHSYKLSMVKEVKANCNILAFVGKMGVGKDYISNSISNNSKNTIIKIGFADALKVNVVSEHQLDPTKVFGERDTYTRSFMQSYGTKRKKLNENIWTDKLLASIYLQYKNNNVKNFIISDTRYLNEYKFLKTIGADIYLILAEDRNVVRINKENDKSNKEHTIIHSSEDLYWVNTVPINIIDNSICTKENISDIVHKLTLKFN